ncbi:MAG TPA: class I tRNA ligase family protein, partial [Acidimicrobiia bacterium]|nr:class I tRNA ligase family protein [Acidimicrobiia bacterium]
RSLERTERFFWSFCDDYLELVKSRAYGDAGDDSVRSARVTLRIALSTLQRLFAPVLAYVSEEVWSWWREGSVHRAEWPGSAALRVDGADPLVYTVAAEVLAEVRKAKSTAKVSLAAPADVVRVTDTPERLAAFEAARQDVCDAGKIVKLDVEPGSSSTVVVELGEPSS